MNKTILFFILFYNKINSFIENIILQEYNLICEEKNINCDKIHDLYINCGSLLFDIWFSLDLLLSVKSTFDEYEIFYTHIKKKINRMMCFIYKIRTHQNENHSKDNQKLLFYINKIMNHQIIKYNDELLLTFQKCKNEIIEIIESRSFNSIL